jgi:hypothetical protein
MTDVTNDLQEKLLQLLRTALQEDKKLREDYQIGDKFRFIRDRLQALLTEVEHHIASITAKTTQSAKSLAADETLVYVYLYNAHGIALQSWQKMLSASVLYEYSVNRPVYTDKTFIETFIRHKASKSQHGYLAIAIKQQDLFTLEGLKDNLGNPLVKVKEGAFKIERVLSFFHNDKEYELDTETGMKLKIH